MLYEKTKTKHGLQMHVIKATNWRIACIVLLLSPPTFTFFLINYNEQWKPEGLGFYARSGILCIWEHYMGTYVSDYSV